MPPIWVGFRVRNSPNKVPFFLADFPQTRMGFPEICKILSKMGSFPPKFIIKVGTTATIGD